MQLADIGKQEFVVKFFCPITVLAAGSMLEAAGVLNSSTRLFEESAM
jgi:hypothetical protein